MWNNRRTDQELALFSQKLGQLLDAGFPLLKALTLVQRSSSTSLVKDIGRLVHHLEEGQSFSNGIKSIQFPPFYCFLMVAAEHHGQYAAALKRVQGYYQKRYERSKQQQKVLAYPCFIFFTSLLAFFLILYGLVPQFTSLYESFSLDLPWSTRMMFAFSESVSTYQAWLYSLTLGFVMLGFALFQKKRIWVERFLLKAPLSSFYCKLQLTSAVALQMGYLLEGGVGILTICGLFSKEGHWLLVRQSFEQTQKALLEGKKLSEALSLCPYYLPILSELIMIAEEAGTLDNCLLQLGDQLEEELDRRMERFATCMETFAILGAGIFVTLMMLSLFVPMFDFIQKF